MKIYYDKRLKDPTYYAQIGIRNGKKTTTRNVKNFGKHSELLKITDDPLAYVQKEIEKMNEEYRVGESSYTLTIDFNEKVSSTGDKASSPTWVNIGYFFIQFIMENLNLKEFFRQKTEDRRMTYDCFTVSRFLTYARILDPCSKLSTWDHLGSYYEDPQFDYQHILRFMDLLADNYTDYLTWLYRKSNNVVKRDTSVLYYDCTNFYFECEHQDEDLVDEVTGEIIPGLRYFGMGKDHKPNPIVEMGLFMDRQGIPITMSLHPGNTSEAVTALPLEKEVIKMLDSSKVIYCADASLNSCNIRRFNSMGGRAFIVTQSIKKLGAQLQEAVFNDFGYHRLSNGDPVDIKSMKEFDIHDPNNRGLYQDHAYKIIPADKLVDLGLYEEKTLKNGSVRKVKATGRLEQHLIVTFSRKQMEYQRNVRNRQVERAKKLLKNKDPEDIKKGPNDVQRFIKRVVTVKKDDENENEQTAKDQAGKEQADKDQTVEISYELNESRIAEEEKYDGFYAVATNLNDSPEEILAVSHQRYKIEDCFRIMKSNLCGRPTYHRNPDRIRAHFLICYTALLVHRLMQVLLDEKGTHVTTNDLINTMKNMNVTNIHDVEYMALYNGSDALNALVELSGLNLDHLHYRPKDLNKMIKKISK